jgi:hypothetical protein
MPDTEIGHNPDHIDNIEKNKAYSGGDDSFLDLSKINDDFDTLNNFTMRSTLPTSGGRFLFRESEHGKIDT